MRASASGRSSPRSTCGGSATSSPRHATTSSGRNSSACPAGRKSRRAGRPAAGPALSPPAAQDSGPPAASSAQPGPPRSSLDRVRAASSRRCGTRVPTPPAGGTRAPARPPARRPLTSSEPPAGTGTRPRPARTGARGRDPLHRSGRWTAGSTGRRRTTRPVGARRRSCPAARAPRCRGARRRAGQPSSWASEIPHPHLFIRWVNDPGRRPAPQFFERIFDWLLDGIGSSSSTPVDRSALST